MGFKRTVRIQHQVGINRSTATQKEIAAELRLMSATLAPPSSAFELCRQPDFRRRKASWQHCDDSSTWNATPACLVFCCRHHSSHHLQVAPMPAIQNSTKHSRIDKPTYATLYAQERALGLRKLEVPPFEWYPDNFVGRLKL